MGERRDDRGTVSQPNSARAARVVHLVHAWNDRTIAAVAASLADAMTRQDVEVAVMAVTVRPGAPALRDGIPVVDLGGAGARTVTVTSRLRSALREASPDVVFAHGNGPVRAAILATRALRGRPRLIGVEHNHYSSYAWNLRALRDRVNAALLPRADLVIGVSPGIVEDLGQVFPRLRPKLRMVPPPLTRWELVGEMAAASPDHPWFSEAPEIPVITSVGHVHPRKDQITLVRALSDLRRARPDRLVRLAIVGNASGEYADEVRALVEELGLGDDVVLLGLQVNPLAYVARSAVFVLSSRNEGMPVTLLEAMACGTPAVSTDCPSGPRWLFDEERCGLLAPVGDHAALSRQIGRVLDDPALGERLRAGGRARAKRFTPERIATEQLILAGLAGGGPAWPRGGAAPR